MKKIDNIKEIIKLKDQKIIIIMGRPGRITRTVRIRRIGKVRRTRRIRKLRNTSRCGSG